MSDDTLLIILGNQLFDKKYLSEGKTKNIFSEYINSLQSNSFDQSKPPVQSINLEKLWIKPKN